MSNNKIGKIVFENKKKSLLCKKKVLKIKTDDDDVKTDDDDDDGGEENDVLYDNISKENIKKVKENNSIYKDKNIRLSYHRKIFSYQHMISKYYKFRIYNNEDDSYCNIYLYLNKFKNNLLYNKINNIILYLNIKVVDNNEFHDLKFYDLYYDTLKNKLKYTFKYSLVEDKKEYKNGKIFLKNSYNKEFNKFIDNIYSIKKICSLCDKKIKIIYKCDICKKSYLCLNCKNDIMICKDCKTYSDDFIKKSHFFRDECLKNREIQKINTLLDMTDLQEIKKIKMSIENISKIEYYNILCNEVKNINHLINRINNKIKERFFDF